MKDRMTLGRDADVAESAALTLADDRAMERIVEHLDREYDERSVSARRASVSVCYPVMRLML